MVQPNEGQKREEEGAPAAAQGDESDELLKDVDFGDEAAPAEEQQNKDGAPQGDGESAAQQSAQGSGEGGGEGEGEGSGEGEQPKTVSLSQEDYDRLTKAADRVEELEKNFTDSQEKSEQAQWDAAERQAIDEVAEALMKRNPELSLDEAKRQAEPAVRQVREQYERTAGLDKRERELSEREQRILSDSRETVVQKLRVDNNLTAEQVEQVRELTDVKHMATMAQLFGQINASNGAAARQKQEQTQAQDFGGGHVPSDIARDPAEMSEEDARLMNLDNRDGTLSEEYTEELIKAGYDP